MVLRMQAAFPRSIATLRRCIRNILEFVFYDRMYRYLFICSEARRLTSRCSHYAMAEQRNLVNVAAMQLKWTITFGKLSTLNDEYKYPLDMLICRTLFADL